MSILGHSCFAPSIYKLILYFLVCSPGLSFGQLHNDAQRKHFFGDAEGTLVWEAVDLPAEKRQVISWVLKDGRVQPIDEWPNFAISSNRTPLSVIRQDDTLAMLTGDSGGSYNYFRYERHGGRWHKVAECPLGSKTSNMGEVKLLSLTSFRFWGESGFEGPCEVTDQPLVPGENSLYRVVLRDGQMFRPEGVYINGAIWGLSKAEMTRSARVKALKAAQEQAAKLPTQPLLALGPSASPQPAPLSSSSPHQTNAAMGGWAFPLALVAISSLGLLWLFISRKGSA